MDLTCSAPEASSAMRGSAQLWRKLLVPDLASTGFILTLFLCLLLFDGTTTLFRDADSGWHIRIGEQILATGTVPNIDPFSFSREGQPWFAWEWLADVAMAIAHKSAGLAGVALLYSLAIGACTWLWFRLNWTVGGNFFLTAILAALMLSTSNLHWLARPHVFSWLLLLGLLIFCETAKPKWNWTEAAALALCGILWANIHASFFLGSLLLVLYGIGRWTASFLWPHAIHQARYGKKFFSLSAILLLSSVANPYGWHLHEHVFRYLTDHDLLARIGEFQSFNFHDSGALRILLTVLIAGVAPSLCLRAYHLDRFLVILLLLGISLRSARALPILALLALPLANAAITRSLQSASGLRASLRQWLDSWFVYSNNLRALDASTGGYLTVAVVVILAAMFVRLPAVQANSGFPRDTFPTRSAEAIEGLPCSARLLAPDLYGGYLIYRFGGTRKVFFDGRSDFYGSEFLKSYTDLVQVRPDWEDELDRHRFTHALLPNRYSLIDALQQHGWRVLHRDNVSTLLEKP